MARDGDDVRARESSDPEVLTILSSSEDTWIRVSVAENPSTPVEILGKLSTDVDQYVRGGVAENPSTPVEILGKLSTDEVYFVRREVAGNPNTPIEVLIKLSADKDRDVRCRVAENPSTPVRRVRSEKARRAGENYLELFQMYDAAATEDSQKLAEYRSHHSRAVRFGAFCNPLTVISTSDLGLDSIFKFAAIANPSTPTEVLDAIGLNQANLNPIFPISINKHKNVSKEFQVYFNLSGLEIDQDLFDDDYNPYFGESIYKDYEGENYKKEVDLESLQSLLYLYILGFIQAPSPTGEFWTYIFDDGPEDFVQSTSELFGSLPAIPEALYDECDTIQGARCLAGASTKNHELMEKLSWDTGLLDSGSTLNWQNSRSPRSSVASNDNAPPSLLKRLFYEEIQDAKALSDYLCPVFWRLCCNPVTPEDVLAEIVSLIESNKISDEFAQIRLLVGEPDDFPFGLITNRSVQGDLRNRVEALIRERDLDPAEYEVI